MSFYDFIEIGTSDFETEIEKKDNKVGISVEPIQYYLDRIPDKKNCIKLNIGISNYNGTCIVNYLSEETMQKYNFPSWVRGCNSINSYHTQVSDLCKKKGINIETISEKQSIGVMTLHQLMENMCVSGVYFLKIDTEGHDTVILKKFHEDIQNTMMLPHVIQFESNVLSSVKDVDHIIHAFSQKGYDLIQRTVDTILKLNLKKRKDKTTYTSAIKNYHITDYPLDYNLTQLPHENTLEGAKEYCIQHNCSCVTLQDGMYQVRNGAYIQYVEGEVYSWIFL